jgi:hypothetical protein
VPEHLHTGRTPTVSASSSLSPRIFLLLHQRTLRLHLLFPGHSTFLAFCSHKDPGDHYPIESSKHRTPKLGARTTRSRRVDADVYAAPQRWATQLAWHSRVLSEPPRAVSWQQPLPVRRTAAAYPVRRVIFDSFETRVLCGLGRDAMEVPAASVELPVYSVACNASGRDRGEVVGIVILRLVCTSARVLIMEEYRMPSFTSLSRDTRAVFTAATPRPTSQALCWCRQHG